MPVLRNSHKSIRPVSDIRLPLTRDWSNQHHRIVLLHLEQRAGCTVYQDDSGFLKLSGVIEKEGFTAMSVSSGTARHSTGVPPGWRQPQHRQHRLSSSRVVRLSLTIKPRRSS